MAAAPAAPPSRLFATAAARPSFSPTPPLRPPALSLARSLPALPRPRRLRVCLAAASKDTASGKGQELEQEPSAAAAAGGEAAEGDESASASGEKRPEAVAAELKEVLRARKEAEAGSAGGGWWAGVAQEMAEIEWPAPGKVVGTTGVVLGVIAGSTAALLSVNALLAELSDRVFAGRGLQDFFSG
ncbi:hypothetical protein ACP4OV_020393 [Aristida adscensionis]